MLEIAEQGFYEVRTPGRDTEVPLTVASNVDLTESDLTALDPQELVAGAIGRAGGAAPPGANRTAAADEQEQTQRLWWYLLLAGLLLLARKRSLPIGTSQGAGLQRKLRRILWLSMSGAPTRQSNWWTSSARCAAGGA